MIYDTIWYYYGIILVFHSANQQSFLESYSSMTLSFGLFHVSTIIFWLMKNDIKHHTKKNRNGTNLTLAFWPAISGKPIMHTAAPNRFVIVEYGIMFGSTISGMYNHTIGPNVNPKNVIKTHMPIIMAIDWGTESLKSNAFLKKNEMATMPRHTMQTNVPNWIKNFLPFLFINEMLTMAAITETIYSPSVATIWMIYCPAKASSNVDLPYTAIALTPDICCRRAMWIAKKIATRLFDIFGYGVGLPSWEITVWWLNLSIAL